MAKPPPPQSRPHRCQPLPLTFASQRHIIRPLLLLLVFLIIPPRPALELAATCSAAHDIRLAQPADRDAACWALLDGLCPTPESPTPVPRAAPVHAAPQIPRLRRDGPLPTTSSTAEPPACRLPTLNFVSLDTLLINNDPAALQPLLKRTTLAPTAIVAQFLPNAPDVNPSATTNPLCLADVRAKLIQHNASAWLLATPDAPLLLQAWATDPELTSHLQFLLVSGTTLPLRPSFPLNLTNYPALRSLRLHTVHVSTLALPNPTQLLALELLDVNLDPAHLAIPTLQYLNLSLPPKTDLPRILTQLPQLSVLNVSNNPLATLDPTASNILSALAQAGANQSLTHLDLTACQLSNFIVPSHTAFPTLHTLYLTNNQLTTLTTLELDPSCFPNLLTLDLADNNLRRLEPGPYSHLSNLRYLFLNNNVLTRFDPTALAHLSALILLELSANAISAIPGQALAACTNLEFLNLYGNRLTALPAHGLGTLSNLRILSLGKNLLASLPDGALAHLPGLVSLGLAHNRLDRWRTAVFGPLGPPTTLTIIDLGSNAITRMDADALRGLTRLQTLRLQSNQLTTLPPGLLDNLPALSELNQLGEFPTADAFTHAPGLFHLDLTSNPLRHFVLDGAAVSRLDTLLLGQQDCSVDWTATFYNADAAGLAHLSALSLDGATVTGLQLQNLGALTSLSLPANQVTSPDLHLALDAWPNLGHLRVACLDHVTSVNLTSRHNHAFDLIEVVGNAHLETLDVSSSIETTALNVSFNPQLTVLPSVAAEQLDVSGTAVPLSPAICGQHVRRFVALKAMTHALDWTEAIRECLRIGIHVMDLSDNGLEDPVILNNVLSNRLYVGNALAANCSWLAMDGLTPVCDFSDLPTLLLEGSPTQCQLTKSDKGVVNQADEEQATLYGEHRVVCTCSPGYRFHRGACRFYLPLMQNVWFLVLLALLIITLVGGAVTYLLLRWHRSGVLRLEAKGELERQLLVASYDDEIAELKQAWEISADELQLLNRIDGDSPGAFGEVWRAEWNRFEVCVKVLQHQLSMETNVVNDFEKEIDFLQRTRHPHLVRLFGAGYGPIHGAGETSFLVLELLERGSLKSVLRGRQPILLTDEQRCRILLDVAQGLAYLHNLGHTHRDIKSGNVLITADFRAKVSDFGSIKPRAHASTHRAPGATGVDAAALAGAISEEQQLETSLSLLAGTPLYLAPEVLRTGRNGGPEADVFAFGVLAWETIMAASPDLVEQEYGAGSRGPFLTRLLTLLEAGKRLEFGPLAPTPLVALTRQCWHLDPASRPTLDHVCATLTPLLSDSGTAPVAQTTVH
ncbi:uncharacterized protein MONBRDRAFT_37923 [Monosiga brevicollis MX1]|uniref:non-specific serine/threonine protein kinase n=1 Tax=Monosiga brevicollis TaxID=81824 RepID=A9V4M5_MONBE|nr:uncharacterized protein MONBRDRAFT_37923 [Monosiga brevicollis MX1]EDQ87397.1 predicted protein [Monosiga brevicollis MX1]|eukprot:XP_001747657.1 hypothetical protein [Monosiga brevicollis MX1]